MGLARSLARAAIVGDPSGLATPEKWVIEWFKGGVDTPAGIRVDTETALTYSAFYAAVRVITEDVASLPLPLYERIEPRGKRRATEHPLYEILHDEPNPVMGSMQFRETIQGHVCTWGGGFAEIERNGSGRISALWPLRPDRMAIEVLRRTRGRLDVRYRYEDQVNGIKVTFMPDEILHVAGLGFDGVRGYSPVALERKAIGLGLATEHYGSAFFGNGSRPAGVLKHPRQLSDDAYKRLQKDWEEKHRGLDRAQRVAILEEGLEWQAIGIPPEDAQFLECVVAGTLVTMADGTRRPVEALRVGDLVESWSDEGKLTAAPVAAVGRPSKKELVKIQTVRGRALTASIDHPMLTRRTMRTPGGRPANGDEWIPMGELQIGMHVRVALGHLAESDSPAMAMPAYFLGAMVGDGYIRRGGCSWTSADDGVTERMTACVSSLGGSLRRRTESGINFDICTGGSGRGGSAIRDLLNSSGLVGTHSNTKFVPEIVTESGPSAWTAFLSGYFDADGSLVSFDGDGSGRSAYWSSTSRDLLEGTQHLLTLLGIQSAIYEISSPGVADFGGYSSPARAGYGLYVTGTENLRALALELDLAHGEKVRRLSSYLDAPASRYRLDNWLFDRIATIEYLGPGETVGVEIAGTHTHVTGGIVTHNTRKFQRNEIASIMRLAPHKIGDLERATFSNIEHSNIDHVVSAIRSWLVRWEQAIRNRLLTKQERQRFFAEHIIDGLLRGDTATRYSAYATARQWGWQSANDIREKENENPIEGGDVYLVPLNMQAADDVPRGRGRTQGTDRGIDARKKIAEQFVPLFEDIDRRIAKMERAEVESLIRRHLESDSPSLKAFEAALLRLYEDTILPKAAERWRPVMAVLATEIARDAAEDLRADDFDWLDDFVKSYAADHAAYRSGSSKRKILAVGGVVDSIRALLVKFVDERPGRTAKWETNQLPNATTRETWRRSGIQRLQWVSSGGDCPYCLSLDGKIVGIEDTFVGAGSTVGGGDEILTASQNTFHPPVHAGCQCSITTA